MKPLSQLLQEANNELGKHALTYEQMLGELKQSQEDSRQFINNLLETNKELRKLAYRDELTGLYNHRFFLSEIDKELERAKRYGHPLSLTFFDIDFFKNINDTYGHLVGDVVLRSIATKVSSCMRSCDIVVRYGGDEFAIIMPETDRAGLESLCERLRQEVEAMDIPLNGNILGVTISVGGACFGGGDGAVTRFSMLSIADQAIYQSKKSGRNTVTIKSVA
jgi:diguanylate cyclase (GGDEF)-like protein